MTIKETIQAIRDLAADPHKTEADLADDMHEAEFILATCNPPLAGAAYHHLMSMFLRLRDRAIQTQEV